jgi:hypothetical protein
MNTTPDALKDADVDGLRKLMWGDSEEPRQGTVEHEVWAYQRERQREMMRKFLSLSGLSRPAGGESEREAFEAEWIKAQTHLTAWTLRGIAWQFWTAASAWAARSRQRVG